MPELDVRRPFTRAAALAAGLTDAQLRGPRFQRVFTRVHLGSEVRLTSHLRAEAALLLHPSGAFASHSSAARLLRLPVHGSADEHVTVAHADQRRRTPGIRCHVSSEPGDVMVVDGLRASSPTRAFVELATLLDLVDLVVAGDHLVRWGHVTVDQLRRACDRSRLPGSRAARRAARHVRADVDSPMETRLRMLLVLAGLPEPQVNVLVRDHDGSPLRRYDLSYPGARVAVEYDGRHHVERVESWEDDLRRREEIDDDGWRLLVVTASGIYRDPEQTLRRVHRLLRARRVPGTPTRLGDAWRPHFPGR